MGRAHQIHRDVRIDEHHASGASCRPRSIRRASARCPTSGKRARRRAARRPASSSHRPPARPAALCAAPDGPIPSSSCGSRGRCAGFLCHLFVVEHDLEPLTHSMSTSSTPPESQSYSRRARRPGRAPALGHASAPALLAPGAFAADPSAFASWALGGGSRPSAWTSAIVVRIFPPVSPGFTPEALPGDLAERLARRPPVDVAGEHGHEIMNAASFTPRGRTRRSRPPTPSSSSARCSR